MRDDRQHDDGSDDEAPADRVGRPGGDRRPPEPARDAGRGASSRSLTRQQREQLGGTRDPVIQLLERLAPMLRAWNRHYQPLIRQAQRSAEWLAPTLALARAAKAASGALAGYESWRPPNWPQLGRAAAADLVELAEREGLPVAWVPPAEVLLELLDEPDGAARRGLLLARRQALAEDCRRVLAEVAQPELAFATGCLAEAVDSVAAGRWRSAQALATAVLTTLIQDRLGLDNLSDAREKFRRALDEAPMSGLRLAATVVALPPALERFWPSRGDPVPSGFNRHASAHALGPVQYTEGNALLVVLLATSLLRQLQDLADEECAEATAQRRPEAAAVDPAH